MRKLSATPQELHSIAQAVGWAQSRITDNCAVMFSRDSDKRRCAKAGRLILLDVEHALARVFGPAVRFREVNGR